MDGEIFTVYVLYSEKWNKHYSGYTSNLLERFRSHNLLGKDWTARYRPWHCIYSEPFATKQAALAKEKWMKSGAGRDFIKQLTHTF